MLRLEFGGAMSLRVVSIVSVFALAVACSGEDGEDGEDGVSWLTAAVPAAASDCPNGGTTVQVGPDGNRNGTLDAAEVTSSSHVCNGEDGDPSDLWLVATEEADTDRCAWGGMIVHTGKDTDGSEVLEAAEVLSTQAACKSPVFASGRNVLFTGAGADDKLATAANWAADNPPLEGDTLVFPPEAAQRVENDFPLVSTFGGLDLAPGTELFGKKMVVLGEIVGQALDEVGSRIELPLVVRAAPTILTVLHSGTGQAGLTISGAIEGPGSVRKGGNGALYLTGTNSYHGGTHLAEGLLSLSGGNAIPDTSAFTCATAGDLLITAAGETLASIEGTCDVSLAGPLTLISDEDMSIGGAMLGAGVLTKRGSGFLALIGDGSSHTGALLIEAGSVFINSDYGATPVTVGSGSTLAGNGNPGAITVASGGIVAPGGEGDAAIFTSSGNVTFAAGSTLSIELEGTVSGTQYDRLAANGDVALNGATLAVDMEFSAADGNTFTIVQCTGALTGTFAGLADGAAVTFESQRFVIDYTASSVVLTRDNL